MRKLKVAAAISAYQKAAHDAGVERVEVNVDEDAGHIDEEMFVLASSFAPFFFKKKGSFSEMLDQGGTKGVLRRKPLEKKLARID